MQGTEAMNDLQDVDGGERFLDATDYDHTTYSLGNYGVEGLSSDVDSTTAQRENHFMTAGDLVQAGGVYTLHRTLTSDAEASADNGVTTDSRIVDAEGFALRDVSTTALSTQSLSTDAQTLASDRGDTTVNDTESHVSAAGDPALGGSNANVLNTDSLTSTAQTLASDNGDTTVQSLTAGAEGLASESSGTIVQNTGSHVSVAGDPALGGAGATVQDTESHISSSGSLESDGGVTIMQSTQTVVTGGNAGGSTVQNTGSYVDAVERVAQEAEQSTEQSETASDGLFSEGLKCLEELAEEVTSGFCSLFKSP